MRSNTPNPRWSSALALATVLPLALAACGGSDSDGSGSTNGGSNASAEELQYSSPLGPESFQDRLLRQFFQDIEANTDGGVTVQPFYGGSLVQAPDSAAAVTGGRVDLALGSPQYHPSELPISSVTELPFITSNAAALNLALREEYEENGALRQEWNDFGLEVLVFVPNGANTLASKEPMESLDDVDGVQLRAVGRTAQAFEQVGARAEAIQIGEVYEALQRGMVDAVTSVSATVAVDVGVFEAADYVRDVGAGEYTTSPVFMSKAWWDGLDADTTSAIEQARDDFYATLAERVTEENRLACERIAETGVDVGSWSDGERERFASIAGQPLADEWIEMNSTDSFDAAEFLQEHQDRVAQYEESDPALPTIQLCAEQ